MAGITLKERFPAGEQVALHRKVGDWYAPAAAGDAVHTAETDDAGTVSFSGLTEGDPFWAVCGDVSVAVVAKDQPTRQAKRRQNRIPPELAGQTRPPAPQGEQVTGARSTGDKAKSAEAQRRSEASKKAAATRRKNAEKRSKAAQKGARTRAKAATGGKSSSRKGK